MLIVEAVGIYIVKHVLRLNEIEILGNECVCSYFP